VTTWSSEALIALCDAPVDFGKPFPSGRRVDEGREKSRAELCSATTRAFAVER